MMTTSMSCTVMVASLSDYPTFIHKTLANTLVSFVIISGKHPAMVYLSFKVHIFLKKKKIDIRI